MPYHMKGELFDAEHFNPEARDVPTIPHRSDIARTAELEEKLSRFIEHRATYNRWRYGNPPEPLPVNDNRDTSPAPSRGHFLRRNLGSLAIKPDWEDLVLRGVRVKQRQHRRHRIIHRNAALGTTWIEEVLEPEADR